jgi:exopolyphosphatase/pppGpp-phosphohydrolase
MLSLKPKTNPGLEEAITTCLHNMRASRTDPKTYAKWTDQLVKLQALKKEDTRKRVSPDTWLIVAANVIGILLIINHEQTNSLTSKAISFVPKLR